MIFHLFLIASKGKPILISTGVAEEDDIKQVINECKKNNNDMITLLKCTSNCQLKFKMQILKH